jgi:hypothetical protein
MYAHEMRMYAHEMRMRMQAHEAHGDIASVSFISNLSACTCTHGLYLLSKDIKVHLCVYIYIYIYICIYNTLILRREKYTHKTCTNMYINIRAHMGKVWHKKDMSQHIHAPTNWYIHNTYMYQQIDVFTTRICTNKSMYSQHVYAPTNRCIHNTYMYQQIDVFTTHICTNKSMYSQPVYAPTNQT